jgi:outer membrane protein assembly factor BamB
MARTWFCSLTASVLLITSAQAGDWPAFRGPAGNGFSTETNVPVEWSAEKNVRWKVELPDEGNGSPIVVGDRVLVNCAQDEGKKRGLYCFARKDGKLLWSQIIDFGKVMPTHQTNPYCSTTPVSDGRVVVTWHGTAGLFCYDLDGKELWRRDLGEFRHMWGYAASPILYKNMVIQNCAPGKHTFLAAFDLKTGKDVWSVDETQTGNGNNREGGGPMGTWSTPVVTQIDGRDQVVCFQPKRVVGYDPMNGKIQWFCTLENPKGDLAYSSPMISDGICAAFGGYNGASMAVKLGGSGDISDKQLWYKKQNPQSIGTGVIIDGYVYIPDAGPNTIRCLKADTGEEIWTHRAGGSHWGSIVVAEGRAYVTNQAGTTIVFRPNPEKFDGIAENKLDEHCNATPAISDGQIFIRTFEHLYCIGGG